MRNGIGRQCGRCYEARRSRGHDNAPPNEPTPLVDRNLFENIWHCSTPPFLARIGSPIGLQLFVEIEILHDLSKQSRATRHRELALGVCDTLAT